MNFDNLCNEICKLKEEFISQKEQIAKLMEENRALKEQMARMKKLIPRPPMPSELVNEVFATMPLNNSYGLLTRMPNGLLARNVRKMVTSIKMTMKTNKWNLADCGSKLKISEAGLKVEHSAGRSKWSRVRALYPIPKLNLNAKIISYFEVEILKKNPKRDCTIGIGFCDKQFPLEQIKSEFGKNSIGICYKCGKMFIEGYERKLENAIGNFRLGDVIGIGIIHFPAAANSPMKKCFASYNGKLLGMTKMPIKFSTLQLFPAVNLYSYGDSIRANFGQEEWRFDPSQLQK